MLELVVKRPLSENARRLMSTFWPGPLTLLLPRTKLVPDIVTAGRALVGVRMPVHPVAHALIAAAGVPIVAPSANRFGRVSPTLASHVLEDLDGRIDAVLDGGETTHGLESTVIDASHVPIVLYRPGVITAESIHAVCGEVARWKPSHDLPESQPESMPSPGVGIRHYAPRAKLVTVDEHSGPHSRAFLQAVEEAIQAHSRIGVLLPNSHPDEAHLRAIPKITVFDWGKWSEPEQLAHNLFAGLRALDHSGVEIILCPLPSGQGIGAAIRDRLLKGAKS
jgi:L-threonylcarbamoyladenylate synthase